MKLHWYTCDKGICLYEASKADRYGALRCIKHGAILNGAPEYQGKSRSQIKKLRRERELAGLNRWISRF